MAEWHLDPVYIAGNWTDEMLALMIEKLAERKQRVNDAIAGRSHSQMASGGTMVSDKELIRLSGNKIKVVKNAD